MDITTYISFNKIYSPYPYYKKSQHKRDKHSPYQKKKIIKRNRREKQERKSIQEGIGIVRVWVAIPDGYSQR